ncbi:MAG: permease [Bacillota bacterium]
MGTWIGSILVGGLAEVVEYLSAHVLTCLVPAFFIAGGIAAIVSTGPILRYFGPLAAKHVAYGVASVSGVILAVCSCTVLPLFGGIYRKGAGLGPAVTFLYSGPAINLLAIVLTAKAIGFEMGLARAVGAILFSIVIGLIMAFLYRSEEKARAENAAAFGGEEGAKSQWLYLAFFSTLVAILLVGTAAIPFWSKIALLVALINTVVVICSRWFSAEEVLAWLSETWRLAKLIFPVLLVGVFIAGAIKVILPPEWITRLVGGNSLQANFLAAVAGALMYFSTLTEVPIIKALMDLGMGQGPALALLLAGPAVSIPNMLVVRKIMGTEKTLVYLFLVTTLAAATGMMFGSISANWS